MCTIKKVTLDTIAHELGTTKNTVSRAIRGKPGVSDELRNKINELVEKYGYQKREEPVTKQSPTKVTMVCSDSMSRDTYFWPSVMRGIFDYSAKNQIVISSVILEMTTNNIKDMLPLQEKHCDGILVVGALPDAQFASIAELCIPVVAIDHFNDFTKGDYINIANRNGMLKAVDFLAENGHRKIGFINNESASYTFSFARRYNGYVKRMEFLGLEIDPRFVWHDSSYYSHTYLQEKFDTLCTGNDAPTAWVCVNDTTAYNFCKILMERGLRVPEDVSVIGFDNIPGFFHTQLTTLEVPMYEMGKRGLGRLMRRIRFPDEPYDNTELLTQLVDKGSVKRI